MDLRGRLMSRTTISADGCWVWSGTLDRSGYGKINVAGKTWSTHRLAFITFGPAFDHTLTLDHLCRNRACWRPEHLEPVTMRDNLLRGEGWAGSNARKTHCPQGHEYTEANTRYRSRKRAGRTSVLERDCKQCARDRKQRVRKAA